MNLNVVIPVVVAILAALAGYFLNSRLEKKRSELKFVNDQLQNLYGPLFALESASSEAWDTFRRNCRPTGSFFNKFDPASKQDIEEWRHWITAVFMPINLRIEDVIVNNVHLVEGAVIPASFLSVLGHVASYRAVVAKWPDIPVSSETSFAESVTQNTAAINFPSGFREDVRAAFNRLKNRQTKLTASFGM